MRRGIHGLATLLFASSLYGLSLKGATPRSLSRLPPTPWPGNPARGRAIVTGRLMCAGREFDSFNPGWFAADASEIALAELHSFGWLDDLAALGTPEARARARDLTVSWLSVSSSWNASGWAPTVLSCRLAAWLSHARFLSLGEGDPLSEPLLTSLGRQTRHLARTASSVLPGLERLLAARALLYGGLCGFGERVGRLGVQLLAREIAQQILPDGGHIQRSPEIHARALAALVDARAMLELAGRAVPVWLAAAIDKMAPMLRLFRHGDGDLALFNRTELVGTAFLDAALTRARVASAPPAHAPQSGYVRLCAGDTVVLMDVGPPPPTPFDRGTHAGTLSFEMSCGRERIIVNCGTRARTKWRESARATAAHSTAIIDDTNSSEILTGGGTGRRASVEMHFETADGNLWVTASHDGYQENLGIAHRRRVYLASTGDDLRGEDTLSGAGRGSFAVRFHLHPEVRASMVQNAAAVLLRTPSGTAWRMQTGNGALTLVESVYLGLPGVPRRSEQIVLSGQHEGEVTVVKWAFRRIAAAPDGVLPPP